MLLKNNIQEIDAGEIAVIYHPNKLSCLLISSKKESFGIKKLSSNDIDSLHNKVYSAIQGFSAYCFFPKESERILIKSTLDNESHLVSPAENSFNLKAKQTKELPQNQGFGV